MTPRGHILVIDDDEPLLQLLELSLRSQGYEVTSISDAKQALRTVYHSQPDLIILDIMLPDVSGWDLCRRIREMCQIPILLLTAYAGQEHRVKGLELGADDFLSKPFDVRELMLRVAAILRRTMPEEAEKGKPTSPLFDDGHLTIDLSRQSVEYEGQAISLSPQEFDILSCLVQRAGEVLSSEYIMSQVWRRRSDGDAQNYVKTYIRYLRKKIEPDPHHPRYIVTERGRGYRFAISTAWGSLSHKGRRPTKNTRG